MRVELRCRERQYSPVRFASLFTVVGVAVGATCAAFGFGGCSHSSPSPGGHAPLSMDQLMDPKSCGECHAGHYREWAGSMHAYAADDPLFLAMNARGQRETNGALGTFCVQCHAPLAVKTGATKDGLNLATIDAKLKGITCYWCHSIESIEGAHDNPAKIASDGVMRAEIPNPFDGGAHASAYSKNHDGDQPDAAKTCGTCHDVQNDNGVDLARTYAEWQTTIFGHPDPKTQLTCPSCHMPGRDAPAASTQGAPVRRTHDHRMPGVDVALGPFVETDDQRAAVQAALDASLVAKLCVKSDAGNIVADASLDDAFAGHMWPSGAAYHRRAWLELVAFDPSGAEVFHSGAVPDDASLASVVAKEPTMFHLGDQMFDATGAPTEMLWSAAKFDSTLLLPAVTLDPKAPAFYHAKTVSYLLPSDKAIDKVTMVAHIRPVDFDFVDDLIATGDVDASIRSKLATFTVAGTSLVWTRTKPGLFQCVP